MDTPTRHPDASQDQDTFDLEDHTPHEECGIFGIYNHGDAAAHTALGLHALQHRGQEAAGIVSNDGKHFHTHKALGLVGDNFNSQDIINTLLGSKAIGHVRYSTSGAPLIRNVQPLFADFKFGGLSIAHNGNLTNAKTLRRRLVDEGSIFQSTSDTETIVHLIATSRQKSVVDRMVEALRQVVGAYSLVALTRRKLIGVRDPNGVRPLVLGKLGESWVLTSETCALDIIDAEFVRDVEPGEIIIIDENGVQSIKPFAPTLPRFCIFEYVYFARPDSIIDNRSVYDVRKKIGAVLAQENTVEADVVVPVPDSGVPSAIGYAQEANLPFDLGIIRNHYVGRTFIEPTDQIRHLGVRLKHNANSAVLKDKRVILVDDSIVRGTTSIKIVSMLRNAGAKEIHMRIASPPTVNSCYYGIDTPKSKELMANKYDLEEMAKLIGVDSLTFISIDGLYKAVGEKNGRCKDRQYCDACFSGDYDIDLTDQDSGQVEQLSLLVGQD
ncbi:MAG: amidophosphoribosyltransferase [Rhodospirillales bacterium]|jgi:amidophosphoribosyltransferase|nr:amidophosphoribosyltransferase [Rhodospirillales bacterium]